MSEEKTPMMKFFENHFEIRGEIIGNEKFGNICIDTCFTNDTGKYETYVKNGNNSGVIEIYKNREEAIKGHKKWLILLKRNPDYKPVDVGLNEWIGLK